MSRRKQEKPQPRKNLIKGEADLVPDILTCGVCQKHFPLAEIVRFIQHKVQMCNKENNCVESLLFEDSDQDDTRPPSSTAIIVPKKEVEQEGAEKCVPVIKEEPMSSSSIIKMALSAKDASLSTTPNENSHEPRNYVCSTCKQNLSTAWALIQHVQNSHGLSICMNSSPDEKSEKPLVEPPPALSPLSLRAPLLERQMEPLFTRNSSQDLRLDLIGKSSNCIPNGPIACITPPPLLEPPKISNFQDSSYSQRLRVLAGATSPNAASTPRKLLQPNFKAVLNNKTSPRSNTPPESSLSPPERVQSITHNSSASSTTSDLPQTPSSAKNRLCEYCGKSFQFKSNLIVHRRSHTGEKPFKCHICNHACTQASKLKRHMKTHRVKKQSGGKLSKSLTETNDSANGEGKPKENSEEKQANGDGDCGSDEKDDDEMEEEEVDVEDEEDEEELNVDSVEDEDCLRENGGNLVIDHPTTDDDMVAEDLTKKPLSNGTKENGSWITKEDNDKKPIKHSVVSEIMEKIGFGCIQPYNEAYKQALKESSYRNSLKQDRCSSGTETSNDALSHHSYDVLSTFHHTERPPREGTRSAGQSPLSFGSGLLDSFDQSITMKRIRLEESTKDKDRDGNFLYAGVWFPRVEPHQPQYRDLYGIEATSNHKSESALSGRPGPSSLAAKPKDSQTSRRNDTCEYCGKVFKNCSNLTVHRRSHTGEKPYKCELCSYACAQSSKLTRHMKTHGRLGKDVYRCRFCDMPFSVASTLEKHMRKCVVSQSGGSPYLVSEDSKEMIA